MAFVFLARSSSAIADSRGLRSQFGVVEQFLDVAHPVGPLTEPFPGDRPAGPDGASSELPIGSSLTIRTAPAKRTTLTAFLLPLSLSALLLAALRVIPALRLSLLATLPLLTLFPLLSLFRLLSLLPLLSFLSLLPFSLLSLLSLLPLLSLRATLTLALLLLTPLSLPALFGPTLPPLLFLLLLLARLALA